MAITHHGGRETEERSAAARVEGASRQDAPRRGQLDEVILGTAINYQQIMVDWIDCDTLRGVEHPVVSNHDWGDRTGCREGVR